MSPKKILVHTCCAPCASASTERLMLQDHCVTFYFANSNIFPEEEYQKRLENVRKLAGILDIVVEEDLYDHQAWLAHIRGLENEPEGGRRCLKCFEYSLRRTAQLADRLDFPSFTTTLTISPHKNSEDIFRIGKTFPKFLPIDFKKENGFQRSLQLSEQYDLYRQNYCGCEFSLKNSK
ncbi:MAG: epoxyqueuosine reductase QueH [bacterium]